METFDEDSLKFKIPAGMVIAGPSSSGKSTLMMKLMKHANEMFEPRPAEIVYAYGQYHRFIPASAAMSSLLHAFGGTFEHTPHTLLSLLSCRLLEIGALCQIGENATTSVRCLLAHRLGCTPCQRA
jgi:DNA replication protein DnaC